LTGKFPAATQRSPAQGEGKGTELIGIAAFFTALFLSGVPARQADDSRWIQVAANDFGPIYVDTQSIQRSGDIVTAWYRTDLAKPGSHGEVQWMDRHAIDCSAHTWSLRAYYELQPDGSKGRSNDAVNREAEAIVPGSTAAGMASHVCSL
jgi:hypothetical protein